MTVVTAVAGSWLQRAAAPSYPGLNPALSRAAGPFVTAAAPPAHIGSRPDTAPPVQVLSCRSGSLGLVTWILRHGEGRDIEIGGGSTALWCGQGYLVCPALPVAARHTGHGQPTRVNLCRQESVMGPLQPATRLRHRGAQWASQWSTVSLSLCISLCCLLSVGVVVCGGLQLG